MTYNSGKISKIIDGIGIENHSCLVFSLGMICMKQLKEELLTASFDTPAEDAYLYCVTRLAL